MDINQELPWVKSEFLPMIQQPLMQAIPLKQPPITLQFQNVIEFQ